jgi:peptidoglycan hydrolase CwlO-like protein
MGIKLASEAMAAWAAVLVSTVGGTGLAVYHWGQNTQQITAIQQKQVETDTHVAKHDDQLSAIQQQNAAAAQKLQDIADTVHDIQSQVHSGDHGRHGT